VTSSRASGPVPVLEQAGASPEAVDIGEPIGLPALELDAPRLRLAVRWLLLTTLVVAGTAGGAAIGIPSAAMISGLLVGLAYALSSPVELQLDSRLSMCAQMVTGSVIGSYLSVSTLAGLGGAWLPVLLITTCTLIFTFAAGLLLARISNLGPATAAFGMIAGGAAGIVSIASDLGADDRMVAVIQYVRVVIILAITPLLAASLFVHPSRSGAGVATVHQVSFAAGALYVLCAGPVGILLARRFGLVSPNFFGPMIIGAVLTLSGVSFAGQMPNALPWIAYGLIGGRVGLEFTRESIKRAREAMPAILAVIVLMLVVCAGLGMIMAPLAGVSPLDGYLATTPGVLQVVMATTIGLKANTTFVLSVQVVRLLMMLSAAPLIARRLIPMPHPSS
jgi:membrane AbrB-like protein